MSTEATLDHLCSDSSATETFAETLGKRLRGGEIIELIGDVGAGKTTFVKGLARGIGSTDRVSSPTFTIEQIYKGRIALHHFDFYRLHEPGLITHELEEALSASDSSVVLEWAETVKNTLPESRIAVRFEVAGENERKLHIFIPQNYGYLEIKP